MTIKQLRILPPFAIGRLGSASEPMDNYTFDLEIDPANPLRAAVIDGLALGHGLRGDRIGDRGLG